MTMPANPPVLLEFDPPPAPRDRWMGPKVHSLGQPAVGNDWSWVGPSDRPFKVDAIRAVFTTSATVANRVPHLQIVSRNGEILVDNPVAVNTAAGLSVRLVGAAGEPWFNNFDGNQQVVIPTMWLPPASIVRTLTTALAAGDQWSAVVVTYTIHRD